METTTTAKRILLVEHDRFLRRACEDALRGRGLGVWSAAGGEEALVLARTEAPDLILIDLSMPGLSGIDVLRQLKADPATRDVPVLVLGGSSRAVNVHEVLRLGALEYWVKSDISLRDLGYRVISLLDRVAPTAR
jgi:CheY-like chemotaxis protein